MQDQELAKAVGARSAAGWNLNVQVDPVVQSVLTAEEQAALLEKIACMASMQAAQIRQTISATTPAS